MTQESSIVIPLKGLRAGKSRLSGVLSDNDRFDLVCFLFRRTLGIASAFMANTNVYVVSPDPEVEKIAAEYGAEFLLQKNKGLNLGLEWTAQQLPKRRTAFISADLPNLAQLDVALLVTEPEVGISPDKSRRGTNAITVPGPLVMGFCYGNGSFDAHCELARATAFKLKVIDSHGLSFDLDTETDLSLFKGWSDAINPRRVLL